MTDENEKSVADQHATADAVDEGRFRLLAAEDNAIHQLMLKTLLHQVGVDLTLVDNGKLAVEAWRSGDWDLILMDVGMPEMNGTAAVREIRALETETGRTRTSIVAVTADIMAHQIAEYYSAGMDDHVGKPIAAAALYQAIETALAKAESDEADGRTAQAG
jgi:two-component system, sensor histidine kinase